MIGGLALGFAEPLVLLGLLTLPVLWWLLRMIPPRPRRIDFPPTRLLFEIAPREETPARTPWWLTLIRLTLAGLVIIAIPIFVLGFVAQFVFGVRLGIAPVTVGERATFPRLLLPGIVLGSVSFAYVVRLTRSAVAANAHADYVRTATAKGLSRPRVVTVHILRNSLIPVVTFLGADLGALMGGAIVTEGIFNIHGVGGVLYQAVTRQEAPTVVSIVTVLVVIYLVTNLLVDLLYAALDPRIRYG